MRKRIIDVGVWGQWNENVRSAYSSLVSQKRSNAFKLQREYECKAWD